MHLLITIIIITSSLRTIPLIKTTARVGNNFSPHSQEPQSFFAPPKFVETYIHIYTLCRATCTAGGCYCRTYQPGPRALHNDRCWKCSLTRRLYGCGRSACPPPFRPSCNWRMCPSDTWPPRDASPRARYRRRTRANYRASERATAIYPPRVYVYTYVRPHSRFFPYLLAFARSVRSFILTYTYTHACARWYIDFYYFYVVIRLYTISSGMRLASRVICYLHDIRLRTPFR